MQKTIRYLNYVTYWSIVAIPFGMAFGLAFTNVLIGFMAASFFLKKALARERLFSGTPIDLPFLCIVLAAIVSIKNTIDYRASFQGIIKLINAAAVFLICAQEIKDKRQIKRIIFSLILGSTIAALDAAWQMATGHDFVRGFPPMDFIGIMRATASFNHTNVLGVYMSALTPLVIGLSLFYYLAQKTVRWSMKAFMLVLAAVSLGGLLLTVSRGAAMALYCAVLFISICRRNKVIPAILVATLLIFPFVMPPKIRYWAKCVNNNPIRFMLNDDRISVYKNAANMIKNHPLIGVGVNTFCLNYKKYKVPEPSYAETGDSMYAHNNFLHMGGEIGFLGLLSFIWLLFRFFRHNAGIYKAISDDYLKVAYISLIGCVIGFLVNGLTETSLYYPRVAPLFWFLVGLLLAFARLPEARKG